MSTESHLVSWERPSLVEGSGLVLTVLAWSWLAGPFGLAFGVVLVAGVFALTPAFAFALGQALVLGVVTEASPIDALLAESGLIVILLAGYASAARRTVLSLGTVAVVVGVTAIGYGAVLSGVDASIVVATTAVVASVVAYGLHRFELVQLGLVSEEP